MDNNTTMRYPILLDNGVEIGFTDVAPDPEDVELLSKATLMHPVTIEKGRALMEYKISPRMFGDVGTCNHPECIMCKAMRETEDELIKEIADQGD